MRIRSFRRRASKGRRAPDRFEATVRGNRVTLLHDGAACLPAMLDLIASAERELLFEMYWFGSDRTGRRFAEALSERARRGVKVCVIYDAAGSFEADESMFEQMRRAGCDVREFNPIAPWRRRFEIGLVNHRDHRKILVADQSVAMTGGVNAGDPWAPQAEGGQGWRDDMIRIEGVAALSMREVFLQTWRALGGEEEPTPTMSESELRATGADLPEHGSPVRVLANHYRAQRAAIRRTYLEQIARASSNIYIANSYFIPGRAVRRALAEAAGRGVEVKVLLPGEYDVAAAHFAGRRLYDWLMRHGVEVHEWRGTVLHAKTATIDDRWCTVGTYNLDHRSWRANLEVNVAVADEGVATAMADRFRADLERSERIDPHHWRFRPLSERLLEHFFYLFRKLL
ncbi:MAG TPA: phospholipase D-like domain-containing protein [Sandaracinaceae bacterium LLY-WYZ-13_1]|nr:phospholipase D-like domain-containing protein [Sandaracinaceae bacterium LLY-WYZ-13_1]